ncbi:hypothetical protein [Acidovorax sp. Leaf160]|uniref:hypothetical protein n=1 Tax=Acidovorax sp. Leaf160 TaxID=1736280 RepID=UPI0006F8CA87|nr:hypothetical protein [Acidovorax sp. Leaf160]KQR62630.1 hypothetical protein ASF94_15535 [Acidovorax sp. Leaf160]
MPPIENIKLWSAALAVALLLGTSHLLDGPDELETAQAVAEEVEAAPVAARAQARQEFLQQVAELSR